ncbi:hypothetical protein PVAND_011348 [Polypedilum vanderplanki]|uniref:Uncharacterized protein n=1 Tax=Polypedilum vanderplanki TaxID=319348 RepID=A0A9J6CJQ4_POLVA|nr:hypothetical protein PVAND_011348 [Polypedilum vanderplanki]
MSRLQFFGFFLLINFAFGQYPSNYPRCNFGDSECIMKAVSQVLKLAVDGIPEMKIPGFEPLYVKTVSILQDGNSNVAIKLTLNDALIYGISNASIYKINGFEEDPKKSKYEIHAKLPNLKIVSKYNIDGKILILPIQGNGNGLLNFKDADLKFKFKLEPFAKEDSQLYTKISKIRLQFNTSKFTINLENLFNGNKALGDNMNQFVNENWEIIFQELRPAITEALTKVVSGIVDSVFQTVPYKSLFLEKSN